MTDGETVVLVRNQKIHGMSPEDYANAIEERLPVCDVVFPRDPSAERRRLPNVDVVTGLTVDATTVEQLEAAALFACVYAGTDHLPLDAFRENGIRVTNASGVHGPNAAEQVLAYLLTFARRLHVGWQHNEAGEWRHYQARELQGSTVTVVGLGVIGTAIVERLDSFDVETIGVRYSPEKGGATDEVIGYGDLVEVLGRTDYLVLACPLTETTNGLVGEREFGLLPPDAVVVNVARGPVLDTEALVDALRDNDVRGAALDVTDPEPLPDGHPLWGFDDCLVTPHNAGHTPAYWDRCADILAENVRRIEAGESSLVNEVVPPE